MLFLVISTPAPTAPDSVRARRQRFWGWVDRQKQEGLAREVWSVAGRGAAALFAVDSNETLHRLLNEWANIVPASFQVVPLIEPEAARHYLDRTGPAD